MAKINIAGTVFPSFQIGKKGPLIHQGSSAPGVGLGQNGDIYLQTGTGNLFQKVSGQWTGLHTKSWVFQFHLESLLANGTTDAVTGPSGPKNVGLFRTGIVLASSIVVLESRTTGSAVAKITLNGVLQNGAGQSVTIDATNPKSNSTILSPSIVYNTNDYLGVRVTTSGYAPIKKPATICLFCIDI